MRDKIIFSNFEYWNVAVSKKVNFSNSPILNTFSPKFQKMVLEQVEETHTQDKDVAQAKWLSECPTKGHFRGKNASLVYFALKRPFVAQTGNHIG